MDTVKIPVVDTKIQYGIKIFLSTFAIVNIAFLISFLIVDDPNHIIGTIFLLSSGLFALWVYLIKKSPKVIGYLELTPVHLKTCIKDEINIYSIMTIKNVTFIYAGYRGKGDILSGSFDNGYGNKIIIDHMGKIKSFDLFIDENHSELLRNIFIQWNEKEDKIEVKDFLGFRSTI